MRAGNSITASCGKARISQRQFYQWLQDADEPNADPLKVEFKDEVQAILGGVQAELEDILFTHAKTEWKAALEILRRRFKQEWGDPREPEKVKEDDATSELTKAQWLALAELIAKTKG